MIEGKRLIKLGSATRFARWRKSGVDGKPLQVAGNILTAGMVAIIGDIRSEWVRVLPVGTLECVV